MEDPHGRNGCRGPLSDLHDLAEAGWEAARARTAALDAEVAALLPDAPLALVATGSWGRGELCPYSDVDLLVLWGGKRGQAKGDAERILYPLWDSGRRVGHAVRTPRQCVESAESDLTITCTLLDARVVAGSRDLFDDMRSRLERSLGRRRRAFEKELLAADAARHARFGHAGRLVRPQLKEGRGGLRDAASARWRGVDTDLHDEIGLLLLVRSLLHEAAGRADDVLAPEAGEAYRHTHLVYAAARRIALVHRPEPPPSGSLLDLLRGERDDALDALEADPPALPGWDGVECLPAANPLHDYAVDTHLVTAALEAAGPYDGFDASVFADIGSPDLLVLTALLHDIGKGGAGDHSVEGASVARRAAITLGLSPEDCETVATLVRHHLLLAEVATRRDLADDSALGRVVLAVGTAERLRLLYLLTRADARATSASMWGEWRASLVREAFLKALGLLQDRTPQRLDWRKAELRQVLARRHPVSALPEIDHHLEELPPSYLTAFRTSEQVEHFALMRPAPEPGEVRIRVLEAASEITLLVAARDRPGLMASVSAALAVHGIDVLSARVFTRSDGVALESYRVVDAFGQPITPDEWERVRVDIGQDVAERLARRTADYSAAQSDAGPARVRVDNNSSDFYTVIEVRAPDSVGLLARLARALYEQGVDVHMAKIVTEGISAVDTFYVWETSDGRLDESRFGPVARALEEAAGT